jgi:hypothetical protein
VRSPHRRVTTVWSKSLFQQGLFHRRELLQMPHPMSQTSDGIISGILNWVCPECGGRMGGRTREFKCQGKCRTDWRDVWERRVGKPGKNPNSSHVQSKQFKIYATTEAAQEAQP